MGRILSTQDVPQKERFDYWNHIVSQALGRLDTIAPGVTSFSGRIDHHELVDLDFVRVRSDQLRVLRTEKLVAQETSEIIKVNFHLAGRGQLIQNGISTNLKPGDWVVYDNTRPYQLSFDGQYEQLLVLVPKQQLAVRLNSLDQALVRVQSSQSGFGKIVADLVRSTLTEIDQLPPQSRTQLSNTLLDLLASNLSQLDSGLDSKVISENSTQSVSVMMIKHHIHQHLACPLLSAQTIADALHISKRYLYHIFQEEEVSLSRYIWQTRVEKCRLAFADPRNQHRSITEIAFAWGFNSNPHFSRLFRECVGLSPRAYRNSLTVDNCPAP